MATLLVRFLDPSDPLAQMNSMNAQIVQYLEVLLGLVGVLILAYLTLRTGLPWMFGVRNQPKGPIDVVARYALEPKKVLYLVKAGSQVFLIGTSESQIEYLTTVAEDNATDILRSANKAEVPRIEFRQLVQRFHRVAKND
jgi:flagellar biogenesis protein FliO